MKGSFIKRLSVVKRTTEATGLSLITINQIHQEYVSHDGQFMMPVKKYGVSRIRINPNLFDREIIRGIIHNVYYRKEYPTLCSVLEKTKEEFGFPGGRFCLWRVLKETGYSYKKKDNKQFLYEQRNILEQRDTYLQQIRQQNVNLVYTDETWVNAYHNNDYVWIDSDGKCG